jgi:hypothetical protein
MGVPMMPHAFLILELVIVFLALPLAFRYSPWRLPALPVLWVVAGYAWWQLWRDASFDRRLLWNPAPLGGHLAQILPLFAVGAVVIWIGVRWMVPAMEWSLVRKQPWLWALLMVVYPTLSVYPQGVLYRAFFLHRYAVLFPQTAASGWMLLVLCAAAFGFLHIIFRNPLAVVLCCIGGLLFAWRYQQTGSLLTSNFEHALYGCWLFTVGLGDYFYHPGLAGKSLGHRPDSPPR